MSNFTTWNWVATVCGAIHLCGRAEPDALARSDVLLRSQQDGTEGIDCIDAEADEASRERVRCQANSHT